MIVNKTVLHAFALIGYCKKNIPNYDGEIPTDFLWQKFNFLTGLTYSSYYRFLIEWRLMGIVLYERKCFRPVEKKLKELEKKFPNELEYSTELIEKIEEFDKNGWKK